MHLPKTYKPCYQIITWVCTVARLLLVEGAEEPLCKQNIAWVQNCHAITILNWSVMVSHPKTEYYIGFYPSWDWSRWGWSWVPHRVAHFQSSLWSNVSEASLCVTATKAFSTMPLYCKTWIWLVCSTYEFWMLGLLKWHATDFRHLMSNTHSDRCKGLFNIPGVRHTFL